MRGRGIEFTNEFVEIFPPSDSNPTATSEIPWTAEKRVLLSWSRSRHKLEITMEIMKLMRFIGMQPVFRETGNIKMIKELMSIKGVQF